MQKLQTQLKTVSKSLAALSKQVEKLSKQADKSQPTKKTVAARKPATARKTAAKKAASPAGGKTVLASVLGVIKRSKKGVTVTQLKQKTKLDSRQLSNALYKLSKKGEIYAKSRGLYVSK